VKRFISVALLGALAAAGVAFTFVGGATAAKQASLPKLTIALNGKTVNVGGSTQSGAVEVDTTVTKEKMGQPALFQFAPGKGPADFGKCLASVGKHHGDLNYLDPCGKLVFNAGAPQGKSSAQTVLHPGGYIALDIQPKGTPPHAFFTVSKSGSPASLPKPGATNATIEFGFTGPTTLKDGELVRFVNDGFLVHMDVFGRVKSVADAKKVIKLLLAGKNKAATKLFIGGGGFAGPMSSGGLQQLVVNEAPGTYVQACFMQTQDGRDHTQLGMERMFKITK
jgi:hypothetical protein